MVNAFDIPARRAFLVEMGGRDDLLNAIALNSSIFKSARIIGPAVAGILVAAIGFGMRLPALRQEGRGIDSGATDGGGHPAEEVTALGAQ